LVTRVLHYRQKTRQGDQSSFFTAALVTNSFYSTDTRRSRRSGSERREWGRRRQTERRRSQPVQISNRLLNPERSLGRLFNFKLDRSAVKPEKMDREEPGMFGFLQSFFFTS